jgi:hypothetical protein
MKQDGLEGKLKGDVSDRIVPDTLFNWGQCRPLSKKWFRIIPTLKRKVSSRKPNTLKEKKRSKSNLMWCWYFLTFVVSGLWRCWHPLSQLWEMWLNISSTSVQAR